MKLFSKKSHKKTSKQIHNKMLEFLKECDQRQLNFSFCNLYSNFSTENMYFTCNERKVINLFFLSVVKVEQGWIVITYNYEYALQFQKSHVFIKRPKASWLRVAVLSTQSMVAVSSFIEQNCNDQHNSHSNVWLLSP